MSYTTVQVSQLACQIFSEWALSNPDTLYLKSLESNVFSWMFWKEDKIKVVNVLVKGTTKTIQNLYFQKAKFGNGLILEMPRHSEVTHIIWIDINSGDSALVSLVNLSILLQSNTNADDFDNFKTVDGNIHIVPLDYLECEKIGVRRRNLLEV